MTPQDEDEFPVLGHEGKHVEVPFAKFKRVSRRGWKKIEENPDVDVCPIEKGTKLSLKFQVADVRKPLMSVKRITEKGNFVSFGPADKDNFIVNKISGLKVPLRAERQRFILNGR